MKRIIAYLLAFVIAVGANAAIKIKKDTFKEVSSQHHGQVVDDKGQLISKDLTAMHLAWPTDAEGNPRDLAAVQVVFFGLAPEELSKVRFSTMPDVIERVDRQTNSGVSATLFVPVNTSQIKLTHPRFGTDSITIFKNLLPQTLYRVETELEALHKVIVNAAADPGVPVMVTLGNLGQQISPATFEDVPNGVYTVIVGAGTQQKKSEITVNVTNTYFDFNNNINLDLRHKKEVKLKTKGDKNTKWYIDNQLVGQGEEVTWLIPFGAHNVKAEISADKYDERVINVDDKLNHVFLSPITRKTLQFAGLYNGHPVETRIIEPVELRSVFDITHQTRQIADSHRLTIALEDHNGHKGKKTVKVTENMPVDHQIKLSSGRVMVWPWESDYKTAKWGWEVSYVTKQIVVSGNTDEGSEKIETSWNGAWSNGYNHWLHGLRTGFHFQPAFKFGLGMYTGLFAEFYMSHDKTAANGYKDYTEIDLSMPLHILYQFPLGKKVAIGFHTGPSFNWNLYGVYDEDIWESEKETDKEEVEFGEPPYPKDLSINWDFALWLRLGPAYLSGSISKGMNDLGCFPDFGNNAKSVMKKYVLGVSFVF